MSGMNDTCWQLERELHDVSLYTCHVVCLSLHRMNCKEDTTCLFKKETKGHFHITARIVTARRMRMNLPVSWDSNGLAIWQDFLHP